jgi:sugar lactone lactonase YvrE
VLTDAEAAAHNSAMTVGTPTRFVDGLVFGEGPRWRGDRLWLSDMHGEAVHTVDLDGRLETVVEVPGRRPSGLGFLPDGSLLIVSMLEREVLRWDGATLSVHADLRALVPDGCNDMVVDAHGNAYVGSFPPASDPSGVLVLVRADGSTEIAARDVSFPNGCVIGDGGRTLIVAESLGRRLTRFAIADDGTLSDRSVFADVAPRGPDGICLDAEGAVWAAMTLAHEFLRIAPGGDVLDTISFGDRLAIACTLGGPDLRTLFLLTALEHSPDALRGTRDATIHVVDADVPGAGSP